ncbi:MAG: phosphoenolpyruvate carboxykinase (ATP) [Bacteroidia bacterium]|nr:phosphoenolpyruvate carboxykinase (ATP) [Bacteroidia bacterium]
MEYAKLLGEKIRHGNESNNPINIWLVNTGWTGGPFGEGKRIELAYTRAMIKAALEGKLEKADTETLSLFQLEVPITCPDVPNALLNPRNTWPQEEEYDKKESELAQSFLENFKKYSNPEFPEITSGGPIF